MHRTARPARTRAAGAARVPVLAAVAALHVLVLGALTALPAAAGEGGGPEPGESGGGPKSNTTLSGDWGWLFVLLLVAVALGVALIAFFVHNRARKRPADRSDRGARTGDGQGHAQ
ncbi:hypothetical protein [Vallicoccus soli]|uniref:Uncharacterized protein n=1 Tax=Vallicoccus soli TaxID=2339232 RepID=A0A3A3ZCI1_9ACTN|nr:hypothetical protein [Vallicoccus soli]RJK92644.1 hypothetical protein D5H78_18605 [Vallicoccus soli]